MLDNETKRRIDTARDILVGKVPDPKSQVEQITIALVYKFMDDMDKESIEMGGKPGFFTGEYKKYTWTKVFDPRLGGHEMLALYSDAITRMGQNPKLPQLFRDIFKNAFLPYRDPETLKLFLKTINEFHYDHSERLGDAFEYLLSVLGSQGDAGQFRTPRHIIDFIVSVIQPKKNETILDPACGTAGFLISAFKHILKENTKKTPGDLLTPDDRKRLLANFKGYDISPDMVRLSLVNLYLHGFVKPQVYEYDTLTSEDRWNEYADVILANPPFMTPKGGIKPHKRFSVQSNRSEVLFVDYMAEHLTPTGRAGIIVPEGIIFQSANAYKQLRKYLVDNEYLWAVVSLPAGIFNPYSGVKTSILLMDKTIAKKTDKILFVKIENDGFDLGAQRRLIDKNDLPDAANVLTDWLKAVRNGNPGAFHSEEKPCGVLLVEKTTLAKNGDYNLTGDRYRQAAVRIHQKWPMVKLGDYCKEIRTGFAYGKSEKNLEGIPHLRPMNISTEGRLVWNDTKYIPISERGNHRDYYIAKGDVLFNNTNSKELVGKTCYVDRDFDAFFSNHLTRIRTNNNELDSRYLAIILHSLWKKGCFVKLCNKWVGQAGVNISALSTIAIPLPPLEVQREIVAEIEGYQKIIDGARQVVENWKPNIDYYLRELGALRVKQKISHTEYAENTEEWPMVELGEVCEFVRGPFGGSLKKEIFAKEGYKVYEQKHAIQNNFEIGEYFITEDKFQEMKRFAIKAGDLIISCSGTMGKIAIVPKNIEPGIINQALLKLTPHFNMVNNVYLKYVLETPEIQSKYFSNTSGAAIQNVSSVKYLQSLKIPLPQLEIQHEIIAAIESEQKLVDGNRELIRVYEEKIKKVIDRVWEG